MHHGSTLADLVSGELNKILIDVAVIRRCEPHPVGPRHDVLKRILNNVRSSNAITHPHARHTEDFRKRACHQNILAVTHEINHGVALRVVCEFVIGLIDNYQRLGTNGPTERSETLRINWKACGIVGISEVNNGNGLINHCLHRIQIDLQIRS